MSQERKHVAYSLAEEKMNFITHLVGAALSVVGLAVLIFLSARENNLRMFVSFTAYGLSMLTLYISSTLYHSGFSPKIRHFFRIADHCSIYLLIAGTYTPIALIGIGGKTGWTLAIIIWSIALIGIIYKTIYVHKYNFISTIVYLMMSWLCIAFAKQMITQLPRETLIWLLIGGFFYTTGIIFYLWHKLHHHHGIWHIFVLCGSVSHFISILYLI
ncbi:hemolysin III family protein [bacterium]|nr:hemolysin III family protein [bacterium]